MPFGRLFARSIREVEQERDRVLAEEERAGGPYCYGTEDDPHTPVRTRS